MFALSACVADQFLSAFPLQMARYLIRTEAFNRSDIRSHHGNHHIAGNEHVRKPKCLEIFIGVKNSTDRFLVVVFVDLSGRHVCFSRQVS